MKSGLVWKKWRGDEVMKMARDMGAKAVRASAEVLLQASQEQVPFDTGALSESGTVVSDGLNATVSYDTPYAVRWHEVDANFQNGRKNKYLEDPANDSGVQAEMLRAMQKEINF